MGLSVFNVLSSVIPLSTIKNIIPLSVRDKTRKYVYTVKRLIDRRNLCSSSFEYYEIKAKEKHVFFGYYDISPFGIDGKIIYHEVDEKGNNVDIVMNSIDESNKTIISNTSAWNWQQGSRLRWYPTKENVILFNDFDGGKHIAREIDVITKEEKIHPFPLYDVSPDGKFGITLDFTRLGYKRPGYGYTNLPFNKNDTFLGKGVDIVDLEHDKLIKTITYKELAFSMGLDLCNYKNWYLNHLSFSPDGSKFLLFFIQDINSMFYASLLVYDILQKSITVLEKDLKVSHYDWIDNNTILCTACNDNRCWYNIYHCDTNSKEIFTEDLLTTDGHPSYLGHNRILTDTYPDGNMYQYLYFVDANTNRKDKIAEVFQTLYDTVEKRTDLHPRISDDHKYISFDCNMTGYREMIILRLDKKD